MYHTVYAVHMSKTQLGIVKKEQRDSYLQGVRKDLIIRLADDMLDYGALSKADIADIFNTTRASVSRIARFGKNVSKPVSSS